MRNKHFQLTIILLLVSCSSVIPQDESNESDDSSSDSSSDSLSIVSLTVHTQYWRSALYRGMSTKLPAYLPSQTYTINPQTSRIDISVPSGVYNEMVHYFEVLLSQQCTYAQTCGITGLAPATAQTISRIQSNTPGIVSFSLELAIPTQIVLKPYIFGHDAEGKELYIYINPDATIP